MDFDLHQMHENSSSNWQINQKFVNILC